MPEHRLDNMLPLSVDGPALRRRQLLVHLRLPGGFNARMLSAPSLLADFSIAINPVKSASFLLIRPEPQDVVFGLFNHAVEAVGFGVVPVSCPARVLGPLSNIRIHLVSICIGHRLRAAILQNPPQKKHSFHFKVCTYSTRKFAPIPLEKVHAFHRKKSGHSI